MDVLELSDVIVDTKDDEAGADANTGGYQEVFAETDSGKTQCKDSTENYHRSFDTHGDIVI